MSKYQQWQINSSIFSVGVLLAVVLKGGELESIVARIVLTLALAVYLAMSVITRAQ